MPGSCAILEKPNKVQHFPAKERAYWLSVRLLFTTKESGRGGLGGRGQSAPPGGIFKGGNAPLKWSFASFSSNKKRKAPGGSGDDSPAGRGKCREATKGDGLRAGGLNSPRRRDLRGLIKYKTVKL